MDTAYFNLKNELILNRNEGFFMSDALKNSNITRMQLYKKDHGTMVGVLFIGHDKTVEKTVELLGLAMQHNVTQIYVAGATPEIETLLKGLTSRFSFYFATDYDHALDLIFPVS